MEMCLDIRTRVIKMIERTSQGLILYIEITTLSFEKKEKQMYEEYIGKYCIIRSREQGVMAGYVEAIGGINGRTVKLREARQIFRWSSKFVLIELASFGPRNIVEQKYSAPSMEPVLMVEVCGVIPCSIEAAKMIREVPPEVHDN